MELGSVVAEVVAQLLADYSIRPVRVLAGSYMTSLNGNGFSITLLNVVNTDIGGPSMIELLDDPCEAVGWTAPIQTTTWERKNQRTLDQEVKGEAIDERPSGLKMDANAAAEALVKGLNAVVRAEPEITRFDTVVGDGDCGVGLKRGAEGES